MLAAQGREEWLAGFARRRAAPGGTEQFILRELLHCTVDLRLGLDRSGMHAGHRSFRAIMGLAATAALDASEGMAAITGELQVLQAERHTAKKATLLTAVMLVADWHRLAGPDTWRRPSATDDRMLRQLREWGYPLTEIEERALENRPAQAELEARQAATPDRAGAAGAAGPAPDGDQPAPTSVSTTTSTEVGA